MEVNGGVLALLGIALTFLGPIFVAHLAQRSAAKNTEIQAQAEENRVNEAMKEASGGTFSQQFELQKYIDTVVEKAVEKATAELRTELTEVKKAFRGAIGELSLLKAWARNYIRTAIRTWNKAPTPPKIDQSIIQLIIDDDFNGTLSNEDVQLIRETHTGPIDTPE